MTAPESASPLNSNETRSSRSGAWVVGGVLIAVGVVVLLRNLGVIQAGFDWWALFILIPALAAFGSAWNAAREDGRFSRRARGSTMGGLFVLAVALIFLFNLDWGEVWPVFIILAGLAALVTSGGR